MKRIKYNYYKKGKDNVTEDFNELEFQEKVSCYKASSRSLRFAKMKNKSVGIILTLDSQGYFILKPKEVAILKIFLNKQKLEGKKSGAKE